MNTQYTRHLSMIRRALSIGTLCFVAFFGVAHAEDFAIPSARPVVDGMSTDDVKVVSAAHPGSASLITPNDWTYKALKTLVKHGAITDTHGFTFDDSTSYTKDELMPLLDEVVEKREQMNDNDRQFALRIYQENMRDVMDYRIERDKKITEERRQKLDKKRVEKSGKDVKVSEKQQESLDAATDEVAKPKERALTDEQIKEKMKKFKIDDSRVKTNGDVRIRYTGSKNGKSKADARVQTEMTFTL
ncbi:MULTISPECIES: hypothetical protein [unclassified Veillonella]|uniref:hypothetical protein n=1 Tax=unclassified Veillonella TaxID=2630086 RepID=UPI00044E65C5|nr:MULTISPECIES: hypothetical protein [unclassified Veillonella]EUB23596.1 hypothetical protein HMPREF1504_0150 [Veillonella sp. ICM51a]PQL24444.1 hypothetical protein VIHSUH07_00010 [Veillonella sp. T34266-5]